MRRLITCVFLMVALACSAQQTPQQLVTAAGSFRDLSQRDMDVVRTYLMTIIALGTTPTPATLVTSAAAFRQLSSTDLQVIQTYLLNQVSVANGGTNVIAFNSAAAAGAINSAVTNAFSGQTISIGPGVFTNAAMGIPAGVNIKGAGRGKTILYFTNSSGYVASSGWIMITNNTLISDLTIAPIPDGNWKAYAPIVVQDLASNVVLSSVEIIGHSDIGAWWNGSQLTCVNCRFDTGCDGWTDAQGSVAPGAGYIHFYSCDGFAHMQGFAQEASCSLDMANFLSNSSTNLIWSGGAVVFSNTPTSGQGGSTFVVSGNTFPVGYLSDLSVIFQKSNNPTACFVAGNAQIFGHPYPESLLSTCVSLGDNLIANKFNTNNNSFAWATNSFTSGQSMNVQLPVQFISSASAVTVGGFQNVEYSHWYTPVLIVSNSSAAAFAVTLPNGTAILTNAITTANSVPPGKRSKFMFDIYPHSTTGFTNVTIFTQSN